MTKKKVLPSSSSMRDDPLPTVRSLRSLIFGKILGPFYRTAAVPFGSAFSIGNSGTANGYREKRARMSGSGVKKVTEVAA
ncbi:hypothetical protein C4D60_Mb09t25000 [Musa balbisiana]|uniref:Uncharacterized protein n=1 Tax=Musa balbisiana TaxID=52838 RepID=A0A4S8IJ04_MUSBA|nr:hypothetical protein C4D60_Mb09t25000 [Musa balbisiana]